MMRRNFSEVEEVKGFPNVLLILSPDHFSLVKAFNKYANVFPYFIEPSSFIHVVHRVHGRIKAGHKSFPSNMLNLFSKVLNHPHKLYVKPEDVDLRKQENALYTPAKGAKHTVT
jgi:hypothetical protein